MLYEVITYPSAVRLALLLQHSELLAALACLRDAFAASYNFV